MVKWFDSLMFRWCDGLLVKWCDGDDDGVDGDDGDDGVDGDGDIQLLQYKYPGCCVLGRVRVGRWLLTRRY